MRPARADEKSFESRICQDLYSAGWLASRPTDFDAQSAIDPVQLEEFLRLTNPELAGELETSSAAQLAFRTYVAAERSERGLASILREGVSWRGREIQLFHPIATAGNERASALAAQNRFSVTRQLHFSPKRTNLSLDLVLMLNGLPLATIEIKSRLKQSYEDAIEQYKKDRAPELAPILGWGQCLVHFALDEDEAWFCSRLRGTESRFLPFNQGQRGRAGNPPNPHGLKTDYLWKEVFQPQSISEIISHYVGVDQDGMPIWPRYHQLDGVRKLLADTQARGAGGRYLIQHSAGSGKSFSIAALAKQLAGLQRGDQRFFDSVIIVSDRRVIDKQLGETVSRMSQMSSSVAQVRTAQQLAHELAASRPLIISTVQKFAFAEVEMAAQDTQRHYAVIIDEAHSSQSGESARALGDALRDTGDDLDSQDLAIQAVQSRKAPENVSYYAFTATPKEQTLRLFGQPSPSGELEPFHSYSMRQAIEEGFILDVLSDYTFAHSFHKLSYSGDEEREVETSRAKREIRDYVTTDAQAIKIKSGEITEHLLKHVVGRLGGEARAMLVTDSIQMAVDYYDAVCAELEAQNSPYRPIVAFTGAVERGEREMTESDINGFPSRQIEEKLRGNPSYRLLICADKFQTGFDEPLLQTMYVDKRLKGARAVQTLSRLNRIYPGKESVQVYDFANTAQEIEESFAPYYQVTGLGDDSSPERLIELYGKLKRAGVFTQRDLDECLTAFYQDQGEALNPQIHVILDRCLERMKQKLDEDTQRRFCRNAHQFISNYEKLAPVIKANTDWEKASLLLSKMLLKHEGRKSQPPELLAADLYLERYRLEVTEPRALVIGEPKLATRSQAEASGESSQQKSRVRELIEEFNRLSAGVEWDEHDRVQKILTEEMPATISADRDYQNALANDDTRNAVLAHDDAFDAAVQDLFERDAQLYKALTDDQEFADRVRQFTFRITSNFDS